MTKKNIYRKYKRKEIKNLLITKMNINEFIRASYKETFVKSAIST